MCFSGFSAHGMCTSPDLPFRGNGGKGELQPTDIDKRFYTHEIKELERYRNLGINDGIVPDNQGEVWNNTHTATLEDYKVNERNEPLYTPEAFRASEEQTKREEL